MEYKSVLLKKENGVAIITLNRPERLNAIDEEMGDEITQVIKHVGQDQHVRSVILTGAGEAFCSGADRKSSIFQKSSSLDFWRFMQNANEMILSIKNIPQPVIAAVNGAAVGGGCNLSLACDIIIASEKARFIENYVLLGLHPDVGGTYFLARLVGVKKACELLLTGKTIDAIEAHRIGIVNQVVPAEKLESTTRNLATSIAELPPLAIRMTKDSIYHGLAADLPTALEHEARALSMLLFTKDRKEALAALKEKRGAVYIGK